MVFVGSKWFSDNQVNHFVRHLYTVGAMYKDYVKFIQFVQPKDIPSLFTMADAFVCSSQWQEPLARVHYEAMAAGVPIITSRRGGNPEVIEHGKTVMWSTILPIQKRMRSGLTNCLRIDR